jgi:hypothetical protein
VLKKGDAVAYPVRFEADYAEQRSRLTVFFRFILLIPLAIALFFYSIVAAIAILIAWFAIVITARFPAGLYEFVAGYTRFLTRVSAYAIFLCDRYPPFSAASDPDYPIRIEFAGPYEQYNRLKTAFRFILMIPIVVLRYILAWLLWIGSIGAWFVIVIMGHLPRGYFDLMAVCTSYIARSDAYVYLLTETYPPWEDDSQPSLGEAQPEAALATAEAAQLAAAPEAQPTLEEGQPTTEEEPAEMEEARPAQEEAGQPSLDEPQSEEPQLSSEEPPPQQEGTQA